ncbi:UbiA prenyltransferase family [Suillus discolor]|uniref:UbiA prenyltransferase family n=1 Tax=Suillus discolor TaxID=1912936 RepID=A0A9P7JS09_9AGAM|nr:UbiA prenyltransferase family [Suillus discolor]KAG2102856.1 UbiA prenyltransferase family [Suillus discolor]
MSHFAATTMHHALRHLGTAWLFTRSDFKTMIFPAMMFGTVVSPHYDMPALFCTFCWLWFHVFQFNVSNQSYSAHEDVLNKPWRPVPSGRISVKDARTLRWALMVFCLGLSSLFGSNVVITSVMATVFIIMNDDLRLSDHPVFKNLCSTGGYVIVEFASLLILSREFALDGTSIKALSCSTLVVLLTVQAQDFADVNGDRRSGRRTLPIIAPEGSRIYMLCALPLISFALASVWSLGPLSSLLFVSMGSWAGIRYYLFRDEIRDEANYRLYNIWILCVHLLPVNARFHALAW